MISVMDIPKNMRQARNEKCAKCKVRKYYAKNFDMHFDWVDCWYDCPNDYEHLAQELAQFGKWEEVKE